MPQALSAIEALQRCFEGGATESELLRLGREILAALPTAVGAALPDPRIVRMIGYARAS